MSPDNPPKDEVVRGWIANAEEDIDSCEHLLHHQPHKTSLICFLAQQAAERFLRALLLWHEKPVPRTHNITFLIEGLPDPLRDQFFAIPKVDSLTIHAVQHRYSLPHEKPDWGATVEAHQLAVADRSITRKLLSNHLFP